MGVPELWVFLESPRGQILRESLEAAVAGLSLAQKLNCPVTGLLTGIAPAHPHRAWLSSMGVRRLVHLEGAHTQPHPDHSILWTLKGLCEARRPVRVFFGATALGQRLAPQLAVLLGIGCISQATYFRPIGDTVQVTRPLLHGKVAEILRFLPESAGIVRVFPKAFEVPSEVTVTGIADAEIEHARCVTPLKRLPETETVEAIPDTLETMDLEDAAIVVAGGKGMGSSHAFGLLEDLAKALGGTVAASRVAVDLKWAPKERLVGQTGRKVAPDLYIACGVSGASQHIAGMKESRFILAINTDPNAPIFKHATWGILGDATKVVPALTQTVRTYSHASAHDG